MTVSVAVMLPLESVVAGLGTESDATPMGATEKSTVMPLNATPFALVTVAVKGTVSKPPLVVASPSTRSKAAAPFELPPVDPLEPPGYPPPPQAASRKAPNPITTAETIRLPRMYSPRSPPEGGFTISES
jgi:hypothetical protein